jgi:hypothetical protein
LGNNNGALVPFKSTLQFESLIFFVYRLTCKSRINKFPARKPGAVSEGQYGNNAQYSGIVLINYYSEMSGFPHQA